MVARVAESRSRLVDQSFQAGFAELAKGVLHNLGNAMTPIGVRLANLGERLRAGAGRGRGAGGRGAAAGDGRCRRGAPTSRSSCGSGAEELAHTVKRRRARTSRSCSRQTSMVQATLAEQMRGARATTR